MKPILWKNKLHRTVASGLFAAALAALAQVAIPLPTGVPVTLQTFGAALCGYVLGPALGAVSAGVYLAMGAVGLPVFAGLTGGVGSFVGMTGGYLLGFLPLAALCGWGGRRPGKVVALALGIAGLGACHLLGAAQFSLVACVSPWAAFLTASAPYLVKDIASVAAAYFAALAIRASLHRARLLGGG